MTDTAATGTTHPLRRALTLWGTLIAAMWALVALDAILPTHLTTWGITPRSLDGLAPGIIAAPLLHVGPGHLTANMIPLAVMGTVAALRDWRAFWIAIAATVTVSGLGVWLISPTGSVTVGASGVVFGLFGYLLGRGIFLRRLADIAISVALILLYGSMVWGIFPTQSHVSWQAHLFGFTGGAATAYLLARTKTAPDHPTTG
ncbi:rhomboid family intramembrane serine protease [Glycomyces salinus]|uniref:rhomboid family intramembrane serine protease n=1 Tax=Glycomyces salinus TaxID=980294 RepID=UPI0018ECEB2E|nr:rhomboid family intramembrane serine protease [Glycomyces salinus]